MKRTKIAAFTLLFIFLAFGLGFVFFGEKVTGFEDHTGPWSVGFVELKNLDDLQNNLNRYILDSTNSQSPVSADFVADPFFIKDSLGFHLFAEHVFEKHGDISYFFTEDLSRPFRFKDVVLDEEFHLSYPQVFLFEDNYFMLPETQGSRRVILYVADSFPLRWRQEAILLDQPIQDPTLYIHTPKDIYLFGSANDRLHCWKATSLTGPYTLVASNLLIGTESRAAGRVFEWEGEDYLPVQSSSKGYGTAVSLYKISIDPKVKLERTHPFFLKPRPDIDDFSHGMHHLDVQRIDGRVYVAYDGNNKVGDGGFNWKFFVKYNLMNFWNDLVN